MRRDGKMKVSNPCELVEKEVLDANGNTIGRIDKMWNSWNQKHPGSFFGIRPYEHARDSWFRGTYKLIPIYSGYIKDVGKYIILNKTIDELCCSWNKTVQCGTAIYPVDELLDKPVYDKNHSRLGNTLALVESDGLSRNYGVLIDPYLCDIWKVPYNTLLPISTKYITCVKDTIKLVKTLDEIKKYWEKYLNSISKKRKK
jgi:sporulation protein YlmC with PRC-barrel domain